ncbi:alpha-amylase family glycosyl hydrolase [Actinopolyspora lacussalsi]
MTTVRRWTEQDAPAQERLPWWWDATHYAIDVRLFADSDGDGVGDLDGLRNRLGYLELLGIDTVWLTGVAMTGVGPNIGEPRQAAAILESFEHLTTAAHDCDLRVTLDIGADISDLRQPRAQQELVRTLRFWTDRGVDGFRLALSRRGAYAGGPDAEGLDPETSRAIRAALAEESDRLIGSLVEEQQSSRGVWDVDFNRSLAEAEFEAGEIREAISKELAACREFGTRPGWMVSGRSTPRQVTRYGGGELGRARAQAMSLVTLALPGVVCIDSGEELGLPEVIDSDAEKRPGELVGARVPMPWEGNEPPYGFSANPTSCLPVPADWRELTVEAQLESADSTLSLYRQELELKRTAPAEAGVGESSGTAGLFDEDTVEWYGAPSGCLAFRRGVGGVICALNTSEQRVPLPPGELLLSSTPLVDGQLPPNSAVWLTAN